MKTPITWLELLKEKLTELKKSTGKSVSIGDVAGEAKKDWVAIKEGKHPKYSQGKAKSFTRKTKHNHHQNENKHHNENNKHHNEKGEEDAIMRKIMHECPKCMKKFNKLMKKNKTKKNKKHHKGGENDDNDINTDIVLSGGSDGNAVEDEIIKENTINTEAEKGEEPAADVEEQATAEPAAAPTAATKQAGGKKKRKSNKRK